MQAPQIPADEAQRFERLQALNVLFTPASQGYDEITRLARLRFGTAIALVSLITEDQQWFKSSDGLDACSTSRDISFCGHAIHGSSVFVVEDARLDERFADNPLVTGPPFIRFYAGYPLRTHPGSALGTLCIIDTEPRTFGASEISQLERFGRVAENVLLEREQTVELAIDSLARQRTGGTRLWDLVDPITGNWNSTGLEVLLEPTLQQAQDLGEQVGVFRVGLSGQPDIENLEDDTASRRVIREATRKMRLTAPPHTAHFHNGRGGLAMLTRTAKAEQIPLIARSVTQGLHDPLGWDLLDLRPPSFLLEKRSIDPADRSAADAVRAFIGSA